ncbi:MAG: diacylglycerol/lipid kinase family protein [Thermoanaerobaculia bacterium]
MGNPAAGNGREPRRLAKAVARLRERKADFEVCVTTAPGHATELARDFLAAEPDGVLVAVGGDGTVHEIVQAMGSAPGKGALCFVPAGGGNDAARTIGSPRAPEAAVDLALEGAEKVLDLGLFGREFFFNGVGVGLDGATAAKSKEFRRLRGLPAYLAAALATIARYENPVLKLEGDSGCWEGRALLCAVGNGPSCGGGFLLTPDASPSDGDLDACMLGDFGRLEALANLPKALSGAHRNHPKASFFRGASFALDSDRPLFAHADGEIRRPEFPMKFTVVPGAIRVRAPGFPRARA